MQKALKALHLPLGQQAWGHGPGRLFRSLPDALQQGIQGEGPALLERQPSGRIPLRPRRPRLSREALSLAHPSIEASELLRAGKAWAQAWQPAIRLCSAWAGMAATEGDAVVGSDLKPLLIDASAALPQSQ